jgi:prepilin-type N-terminal cleavage/methylation domain-containing protein
MKTKPRSRRPGFTLIEVLVIISIIAMLAVLMLRDRPPTTSPTREMMMAIESALERYYAQHAEYPTPVNPDETVEVSPGKFYRVGGAKCLYQALRVDGVDAIEGAKPSAEAPVASNGTVEPSELPEMVFKDMPRQMWREVNGHYFLVDSFGRPFQYVKADRESKKTRRDTFDLWSYGEDDAHPQATSLETVEKPSLGAKWIKNW